MKKKKRKKENVTAVCLTRVPGFGSRLLLKLPRG